MERNHTMLNQRDDKEGRLCCDSGVGSGISFFICHPGDLKGILRFSLKTKVSRKVTRMTNEKTKARFFSKFDLLNNLYSYTV